MRRKVRAFAAKPGDLHKYSGMQILSEYVSTHTKNIIPSNIF